MTKEYTAHVLHALWGVVCLLAWAVSTSSLQHMCCAWTYYLLREWLWGREEEDKGRAYVDEIYWSVVSLYCGSVLSLCLYCTWGNSVLLVHSYTQSHTHTHAQNAHSYACAHMCNCKGVHLNMNDGSGICLVCFLLALLQPTVCPLVRIDIPPPCPLGTELERITTPDVCCPTYKCICE